MNQNFEEEFDGFSSAEELYENLSRGGEVEFTYNGKAYSITHPEGKITILEAYNYDTHKKYSRPEDVGEYPIGDKKLKDIVPEIKVTFRCF